LKLKIRSLVKFGLLAAGGLIVALLLAAAGCWLAGGGVHTQTTAAQIHAPREEVFKHLSEPDSIKQWIEGVVQITPLDDLGNTPGARSRVICEVDGGKFEMDDELLVYDQPSRLSVKLTSPMFTIVNTFQLTEDAGVTTVEQTMDAEYHGLARTMAPFIGGATQKQLDDDMLRLKALAEKPR